MLLFLLGAVPLAFSALLYPAFRSFCRKATDYPFVLADVVVALIRTTAQVVWRGGRARFPEWTIKLEYVQGVFHVLFDKYGANVVLEANAKAFRRQNGQTGMRESKASCRDHGTAVEPVVIDDLEHLWIRGVDADAKATQHQDKYVVLVYHGGGYTTCCPRRYIAFGNRIRQAILDAVNTTESRKPNITVDVFLANYRKAPEVQFPVPQEDALRMFEYLRDHEGIKPERIILAGDSAGGSLVMSTLLRLRDDRDKATQPLAAILSCPWTDLTDDEDPTRGEHCIISRPFVLGSLQAFLPTYKDRATWKDASSAFCDLHGLAPALVQVGTVDYLYQDSLKLFAKAEKDGAKGWELSEWKNMPHAFTIYPPSIVPDSTPAIACMGAFVAKQIEAKEPPSPRFA